MTSKSLVLDENPTTELRSSQAVMALKQVVSPFGNNRVLFPLDYVGRAIRSSADLPSSVHGDAEQNGSICIFDSYSPNCLQSWEKQIRGGYINKKYDMHLGGKVLEILGKNTITTFITAPAGFFQTLGIRLPVLAVTAKNLNQPFFLDLQVKDEKHEKRRFRFSNKHNTTRIRPFLTIIPMKLEQGWNEIILNLKDLTKRTYGFCYLETVRIQICGVTRLHKVLFQEEKAGHSMSRSPGPYRAATVV